jgi:hypothetical protein
LELASDPAVPDGYALLHVLLKKLIPAFNYDEIEITWPKYSDYDMVMQYAKAIVQTKLIALKRVQSALEKFAAMQFLNHIINEAHHDYRLQAQMLRTALRPIHPKTKR